MGGKRLGVGVDGAAVELFGVGGAVLGVRDIAGVEECAGVGGVGGEPKVEGGFGGFPVRGGDGGFSGEDFRGDGSGGAWGRAEGWVGRGLRS